jgi:hypothetical protein
MLPEMRDKNADIENTAAKALADGKLLSELIDGLRSKEETYRYNCYKSLMLISRTQGAALYDAWDYFSELLSSNNSYHKMSAVHLIANLAKVDAENRFEEIFNRFFSLLDDRSMIVAYYVAASSAQIVKAKPHLENGVVDYLLSIDDTHHPSGRKELIKCGVIEAFNEFFADSENKARITGFIKKQINSESRKTRKTAKAFLEKWGNV